MQPAKHLLYFVVGILSILLISAAVRAITPVVFDAATALNVVPIDEGNTGSAFSLLGLWELVAFLAVQAYFWIGGFGRGAVELALGLWNRIQVQPTQAATATPQAIVASSPTELSLAQRVNRIEAYIQKHFKQMEIALESIAGRVTVLEPTPEPEPTVEELQQRIAELEQAAAVTNQPKTTRTRSGASK